MTNQEAGFWILAIGLLLCLSAIVILIWDKRRKYKYKESVMGTVISHKRCHTDTGHGSISYPCAVVEYEADGRKYQCIQRYSMIYYNSVKRAEYDWEIDEKYGLHCYVTSRCRNHVDPVRGLVSRGKCHGGPIRTRKAAEGILRGAAEHASWWS